MSDLTRPLWQIGFAMLFSAHVMAENISVSGTTLSNINIYPDASPIQISKTIETNNAFIKETYVLVRLKDGTVLQKTPDGFIPFQSLQTLSNLNLPVSNGQINFEIAKGNFFNVLDYPITVYVGYLDSNDQLNYGAFSITTEFQPLTQWNETAVRKVLHTFAFGGFTTDEQIKIWAQMSPEQAIKEILTFETVNEKVSPPDNTIAPTDKTLKGLSSFWQSQETTNPIQSTGRSAFDFKNRYGAETTWRQAVNLRGLNPIRQKIGFWETNYHLTTNLGAEVGVNNYQIARLYDDILNDLSANKPYQNVISTAALSAAVATQFNHRRNVYDNVSLVFRGNEDFAREYYQIFFGILGHYNPLYHEEITIKNTAQALTDMPVNSKDGHLDEVVTFGEQQHHLAPLEMLGVSFEGSTAEQKIKRLSQYAINHDESNANLPILIVRGLADENLDDAKTKVLQGSWAAMREKNLLTFLRNYAISTIFHDPSRVKYHSPVERYFLTLNQLTLNSEESYRDLYHLNGYELENTRVFRPLHDVFGGQTGIEASDNASIFETVYNRSVERANINAQTSLEENGQTVWTKNWGAVIPKNASGNYVVKEVAEWLWQRFMADGLKSFEILERFHLYALLFQGKDAAYLIDPQNLNRVFSANEIQTDADLQTAFQNWSNGLMNLGGTDSADRRTANQNVGLAVNFLAAIPYSFAQQGQ
ncbi:MAG: hypothetical protein RIT27_1716 [Pseudomonadota bacterium]